MILPILYLFILSKYYKRLFIFLSNQMMNIPVDFFIIREINQLEYFLCFKMIASKNRQIWLFIT